MRRGAPEALAAIAWQVLLAMLRCDPDRCHVSALQLNTRQVRRVTGVVNRLASGDADARADLAAGGELNELSRAVNRLAERTERHALRRQRERARFDTVLHSMSDGVLMLDRRGTVALMNPSAERLLRMPCRQSAPRIVCAGRA